MIGFVHHLAAVRPDNEVYGYSHMMAVARDYQNKGIGAKLKWAQRDRVMEQGIDFVNWTFDPLQAVNANLNVNRLGAVARKYKVNLYGESKSPLHGGLPTARFEVEWFLESERVARAREGQLSESPAWERLPRANPTERLASGLLRSADHPDLEIDEEAFLVEIPRNVTEVMAKDRQLALDWRLKTRKLFQSYFEKGFTILGFHRSEAGAFYRLEREETPFD